MEYRNLGRTGVKVSSLCLGCLMFGTRTRKMESIFGDQIGEVESMGIIDRAIDAGINFLDTANVYRRGTSEETIGKALKRNGHRGRIVLATKFTGSVSDDPNARGGSRRHIIEQCDASLRRLRTDWIDLYQVHHPQSDVPIDETLRALDDLIRAGKVRYIGGSNFAGWQLVESLWVATELGLNRFVSEQPPYHLLDRRRERELVPMAQTYGIALLPWSPLASGFLSGKYRRDSRSPEGSRLSLKNEWAERFFTDASFAVVDVLTELAANKGCTPSQLALAWCMRQPGITSPIIGPRTMEQLEENLGATDVSITDEDRAALDGVAPPGGAVVPFH